ncbi:hypothetical protein SAVERM_761 [Streptomyces avermitilis MA-4680 = NBRC 14893]|uniref:Uncharacterized protein n=1 Tax=Streptomyces avermitilis (strain ATCC 31267 / DSM 46492 / JCM 5070 / NBRC 14893 / NCIMB 12804 / NRRL 8165 / MA-4680) TaxID=227882 RepID=Q82PW1_STRAW|nr:hypothetical protein SAVERM_761 [Streptomyces avermitilis MA-4680 = NBRC 14893]
MRQGSWRFHRDLGPSPVWGYWATNPHHPHKPIGMGYLGPTFSVTRDHCGTSYTSTAVTQHHSPTACRCRRSARTASMPRTTPPWNRAGPNPTKRSTATPTTTVRACSGITITPWG